MMKTNPFNTVLQYSKYGLINGLIFMGLTFMVPEFLIFTLIPMRGLARVLEDRFVDCETGYRIAHFAFLIFAIIIDLIFIKYKVVKKSANKENTFIRFLLFSLFSLLLFISLNPYSFVAFVGTNAACHDDGQAILGLIYSGPATSIFIFINGVIIDAIIYVAGLKKKKQTTLST